MQKIFFFGIVFSLISFSSSGYEGEVLYEQQGGGICRQQEECESPPCGRQGCRSCYWIAEKQNLWNQDRFLEHQYEESSWPSRRDDELSDQLSR